VRYFVVACPKDMAMYTDAAKTTGYDSQLIVVDVARLVALATGLVEREHETAPVTTP